MFTEYATLDQIVESGGLEQIKRELNSYPLYTAMVRFFGFREIGISVLNDRREEVARYASHNNERGDITEIVHYFSSPSIVVQANEKVFVEILHRADWVKEHWVRAIPRYALSFKVVSGHTAPCGIMLLVFWGTLLLSNQIEDH